MVLLIARKPNLPPNFGCRTDRSDDRAFRVAVAHLGNLRWGGGHGKRVPDASTQARALGDTDGSPSSAALPSTVAVTAGSPGRSSASRHAGSSCPGLAQTPPEAGDITTGNRALAPSPRDGGHRGQCLCPAMRGRRVLHLHLAGGSRREQFCTAWGIVRDQDSGLTRLLRPGSRSGTRRKETVLPGLGGTCGSISFRRIPTWRMMTQGLRG